MKASSLWLHSLVWSQRSCSPPEGQPRVLVEVEHDSPSRWPDVVREAWEALHWPIKGYAYHIRRAVPREPRRWSEEALQRNRRLRLWRRLVKREPMFASERFAEAVSAHRDLYGAEPPLPPDDCGPRRRPRPYLTKRELRAAQVEAMQAEAIARGWHRRPSAAPAPAPFAPGTLFTQPALLEVTP